ncbi:hypothetical protein Tco_0798690 [Tanacetum coccineum]
MLLQSSPNHPTSDIEDVFSSNFLDYTSTSLDYFLVSPRNISLDPSDNLSKYLLASLAISPSHDDPYIQAYIAAANEPPILPQAPIDPPPVLPPSLVLPLSPMFDSRDFFPLVEIPPPKDTKTPVESPIPISLSLLVGSSSPVRSTTPPPDYPFDESIFVELQVLFLELDRFGILLGEWEVGQGVSCTPSKVSCVSFIYSILFVLSQGGSMSPNTFLPSIMLLVVIIVTVIVAVVVVVGGVPSIIKLLFVIIVDLTGDEDPTDEDGDIGMGDSIGIPPLDYPFDESIFAELDNSLLIIPQPLGSELVLEESNEMAPKRTSTSATSTMTQAAIMKLVSDSIAVTLEEVANTAQRLMDQGPSTSSFTSLLLLELGLNLDLRWKRVVR